MMDQGLGLPLSLWEEQFGKGKQIAVVCYQAKRALAHAEDCRVLRVRWKNAEHAEVLVSNFYTAIEG